MGKCFDYNDIHRKVIIDTDTGGDDAAALMLAALSPNIEILGVTVAAGNVSLDQAVKNALMTLEVVGCQAPVFAGAASTVTGRPRKVFSVFGKDGMGDKDLIHPTRKARQGSAVDFILETVRRWPDEVEIVELAPATNIALAIEKDPETMSHVRRIWSMGTAGFGMGNATPVAEYNVFFDAEAYRIVTDSEIPMTIIGFDTNVEETLITPKDYAYLMQTGGRSAFLAQALSGLMEYNKKAIGRPVSAVADAVAMACVAWSDYMEETVTCHASTITNDDETHGQVILYRKDIHYDSYIFFKTYIHEVVKRTKAEVFKERFFRMLRDSFIESERLIIRTVEEADREDYLYAASLVSDYPDQYRDGDLADILWRDVLGDQDNLTMLIYEKDTGRPVGSCSFDYYRGPRPEIGINVDPALHNQGIGTETVTLLKKEAGRLFPDKQLLIRTRKDNLACRGMIRKCGGRLLEEGDILTFEL